jgi:hypothetical protein
MCKSLWCLFLIGVLLFKEISICCGGEYIRSTKYDSRDQTLRYPSAPEDVVEAFIKTDFDGSSNEVIGDIKKRMQYVNWEIYPGSDCNYVIQKYQITKLTENADSATVKVKYFIVGNLCGFDSFTKNKKEETIIFGLVKSNYNWKIDYPDPPPYISPSTALKLVNHEMSRQYLKNKSITTQVLRTKVNKTRDQLISLCNSLNHTEK